MDFPRLSSDKRAALEAATAKYEKAVEGCQSFLEARGIPLDVARQYRLGFAQDPEQEHEQFTGRLAIPFLTPAGVVALRFRALGESETKYLQPAGSATHLYNVPDLHRATNHVAICEGELDALVLSALCGVPAIGLTGVSAWKKFYRRLFMDFEKVFIVMDPDKAGRTAAEKLRSELTNGVIIDLEVGDVNEAFLQKGPEFVRERLGLND